MEMKTSLRAHPISEWERVILDGESCPLPIYFIKKKRKGKENVCVAFSAYTYSTSVKEVGELLIGKDRTKQKKTSQR